MVRTFGIVPVSCFPFTIDPARKPMCSMPIRPRFLRKDGKPITPFTAKPEWVYLEGTASEPTQPPGRGDPAGDLPGHRNSGFALRAGSIGQIAVSDQSKR